MASSREQELQQELDRRTQLQSELDKRNQVSPPSGIFNNQPWGINPQDLQRTPLDVVRDLGAGLARGSQNLASGLLEGGEYLTRKGAEQIGKGVGNPVNVPYWNARQFMGVEGNNPIDLGAPIQSQHSDPLTNAIGQYGLSGAAGGANALRQIAMQSAYGASQASPDQQNAFGLLPSGRVGAAIEGGAIGALPFALPKMFGVAKNAINKYFTPESTAKNFIADLGSKGAEGEVKNIPENIQELSKRLGYGQQTAKEEALTPKREIMKEEGESPIFPSQKTGKELSQNTASIFEDDPKNLTPDKMQQYQKALKSYYEGDFSHKNPDFHVQPGDIDTLVEKGEDIFNHPGLNDSEIKKLDESLIPEKPVKGEYLAIKNPDEYYSDRIQEAHDNYLDNPTFRNSDVLRSRLFKRINELNKEKLRVGALSDKKDNELSSLTQNRNAIIKDQDNLIKTFSPENQQKYGKFNQLWREDVRAYEDAGSTIKNMKNGFLNNVTPGKITNAFSFPDLKPQVQKILKDIGPEGVNNILFNEFGRAKNAEDILKIIDNLERNKGFAPYLTPEIRNTAELIKMQLRNKKLLKYGTGLLGSGALAGAAMHHYY